MTSITFDTLKFVKKLEAAGINPVEAGKQSLKHRRRPSTK